MSSENPLAPESPPAAGSPPGRWVRRVLLTGFVASLAAAVWLYVDHRRDSVRRNREALAAARTQAAVAAAEIDLAFREARAAADAVVRDLSSGALPYPDIEAWMRAELAARPTLDGIAVTFEPFAYDPKQRLYQEYVRLPADGPPAVLKGATYDYTAPPGPEPGGPKSAWYHTPKANGPTWNEPFVATGAAKVLIEYGAPFFKPGGPGRVAGVVTVDYSLKDMRELVGRLELGATGYGMVFTNRGTFLAHPEPHRVAAGSVFDARHGADDPALHAAARRALAGEASALDYRDPVSGREGWVLLEPVPSTGWAIGVVRWKGEAARSPAELLRRRVGIALAAGAALVFLVALLVRAERAEPRRLWAVAAAFSLTCVGLVVLTWWFAFGVRSARGVPVTGPTAAGRHLEVYRNSVRNAEPVYVVPTGVNITAVKFPDPASVTVAGFVWQRYPGSVPEDVKRGFLLPQQVDEPAIVDEVQRVKDGADEVIVWSVVVTLQQAFDPGLFPFDHREIAVRLRPAELRANVVFVPDFAAYPLIAPEALPGFDPDIRVNNWHFRNSYFSYRTPPPGPTLGLAARAERGEAPALHLVVDAQRNFVGPFIAYLTPAVVAAGLAFALLMSGREVAVTGWQDLVTGLSYVAALFFVVVVAHASLRETVAAVGITYLEHVYIVLYCAIVLVVANLFLLAHRPGAWVVRYGGNLVPKLLYRPALTAAILASTLAAFVFA